MWRKTLVYLGLFEEPDPHGPDDERDERDGGGLVGAAADRPRTTASSSNVRPLRTGQVTTAADGTATARAPAPVAPPHPGSSRVAIVRIHDFDDVEGVGARYRDGQAVLFDIGRTDTTTGRRVLDFVSGVTYALRGRLEKLGGGGYLLAPEGVEVSPDERRRLRDLGYAEGRA